MKYLGLFFTGTGNTKIVCETAKYEWDFDRLSKKDEIYAQLWYDSHSKDEDHLYYFDENLEARMK